MPSTCFVWAASSLPLRLSDVRSDTMLLACWRSVSFDGRLVGSEPVPGTWAKTPRGVRNSAARIRAPPTIRLAMVEPPCDGWTPRLDHAGRRPATLRGAGYDWDSRSSRRLPNGSLTQTRESPGIVFTTCGHGELHVVDADDDVHGGPMRARGGSVARFGDEGRVALRGELVDLELRVGAAREG